MSFCLIHLRLEFDSSAQKPRDFEFSTPRHQSNLNIPAHARFYESKDEFLSIVATIRGKRQIRTFTVETYEPGAAQQAMEDIPVNERPLLRSRTTSVASSRSESQETSSKPSLAVTAEDEYCVQFYYGNPQFDTMKGILHLHREKERTSLSRGAPRSRLLCMLSVPAYLSTRDLLQWTAPFASDIENLKIIRDQTPNQYMVLIRFRKQEDADRFFDHFNGVPFTSIEPGVCRLAYVAKVDSMIDLEGGGMGIGELVELPLCNFCLEKLDESANGITTILCNHSFHSTCLEMYQGTNCPVCRSFSTPEVEEERRCVDCGLSSDDLWLCLICGNIGCGRFSEKHAVGHFQDTQHTFALNVKTRRVWDYVGDGYVHRLIQGQGADKLVEYQGGSGTSDEKLESITLELESQRHFFEVGLEEEANKRRDLEQKLASLKAASKERENLLLHQKRDLEEKFRQQERQRLKEKRDLENEKRGLEEQKRDLEENFRQQEQQRLKEKRDLEEKKRDLEEKYRQEEAQRREVEEKFGQQESQRLREKQQDASKLNKITKELENELQMNICLRQKQKDYDLMLEKLKTEKEQIASAKESETNELKEQITDLLMHFQVQGQVAELPEADRNDIQTGQIGMSEREKPTESNRRGNRRRQNR